MSTTTPTRQTITIDHTAGMSRDEIATQKIRHEARGWTDVSYRMRPALAGKGWKAYQWTGTKT